MRGCEERSHLVFQMERHRLSAVIGVTPVAIGSLIAMPHTYTTYNGDFRFDVTATASATWRSISIHGRTHGPVAAC